MVSLSKMTGTCIHLPLVPFCTIDRVGERPTNRSQMMAGRSELGMKKKKKKKKKIGPA